MFPSLTLSARTPPLTNFLDYFATTEGRDDCF